MYFVYFVHRGIIDFYIHRLDMTPSEVIELGKRIEMTLAGRQGNPTGANQYSGGKVQNFAPFQKGEDAVPNGKSRDIAAKAVGLNRETYRQGKAVVESGNDAVIARMDSGDLSINASPTGTTRPPWLCERLDHAAANIRTVFPGHSLASRTGRGSQALPSPQLPGVAMSGRSTQKK